MKTKFSTEVKTMNETYSIGTQFIYRGRVMTITDIWKTYDSKDELVKVRYIATHQLMGQAVTNYDITAVGIAKGLILAEGA